jgi:hypothetical protein
VASGTGICLVTWTAYVPPFVKSGPTPMWSLANRIDVSGTALDPGGIVISDGGVFLGAAGGPSGFLLLSSSNSGLAGVRLGLDGSVLDLTPQPLSPLPTPGFSAVADESGYFIAWVNASAPNDSTLEGIRLRADSGTPVGPPFPLVASTTNTFSPSLTAAGSGMFLAYDRYDPSPTEQNVRVRARFVQEEPLGAPCTVATDCGSAYCVMGVCSISAVSPDGGLPGADAGMDSGSSSPGAYRVGCHAAPDGWALWLCVAVALAASRRRQVWMKGSHPLRS